MRAGWLVLVFLFGCASDVSEEDLQNLNGYWEIEKVTFPNGQTKGFMPSTTIDYIQMDGLKGFRKKVQPKFDGSYETSDDAELFSILLEPDGFEIHYRSGLSFRKERVISISADNFSVVNQDTITYTYKRYRPITVNE